MLIIPVLFYVLFCYCPMYGVQIAFKKYNVRMGIEGSPWVGFKYFEKYLTDPYFWKVVRNTLLLNVWALCIGFPAPIILALLMNLSKVVEKIAFPYLMIIQMIPILGMAPIILSITGDINSARIVIAAILTFYPVSTNVLAGFRSVEKEKHELMYSYAANKFQLYTKTLIPACIPYFFTGLKISAPMAITASILVDTLQGGNGLGCMLSQSLKGGMTRLVFWDIVLISAVIGILSFVLMGLIERLLCPYKRNRSSD